MNRPLAEILICPGCLPAEIPLTLRVDEADSDEVVQGNLACRVCRTSFAIRDGLAELRPASFANRGEPADKYQRDETLSSYLWSHFADLCGDPGASEAYLRWGGLLANGGGAALDLGCAVGRMTFELARRGDLAIGIDRSRAFIRAARRLARDGELTYPLTIEGRLSEPRCVHLPPELRRGKVEFLVADALALPFPRAAFGRLASLNLLDKVPDPRRHLAEVDRVAAGSGGRLLISDPFSWSVDCAPEEKWLGGSPKSLYPGRGAVNLGRILSAECRPPWRVRETGIVPWTIRNHANHFEMIRSHFLLAER